MKDDAILNLSCRREWMKSPFIEMTEGGVSVGFEAEDKDAEIRELKAKLEKAEKKNFDLSQQLEKHKEHTKQLMVGWKLKEHTSNDIIASQAREKDHQLSEIMSDLIYFESCLLRQKKVIADQAREKNQKIKELERTIKRQQKQIDALNRANERLLESLHNTPTRDGSESDADGNPSEEDRTLSEEDPSRSECESDDASRSTSDDFSHTNGHASEQHFGNQVKSKVQHSQIKRTRSQPDNLGKSGNVRRYSDINGLYRPNHPGERNNNNPKQRVRFIDEIAEQKTEPRIEESKKPDLSPPVLRLRKISLPAYRLPLQYSDEEYI